MDEKTALIKARCVETASTMIEELSKVLLGKPKETVLILCAMLAGGHVLIEDIPGVGKTTLASGLARIAGLDFNRVQFTPDITASDITGYNLFNRKTGEFEFRSGAVMCNVLLADEINRASPKTQSSLLEAMGDGKVTVDGTTYTLPDPFMVIATQNPLGYVGTYPLPEAQLDRFAVKFSLGYPDRDREIEIAMGKSHDRTLGQLKPVANRELILAMRAFADQTSCDKSIYQYTVDLVAVTRKTKYLSLGASPRASIMLGRLAKAYAFIDGRSYVLPSDISRLFVPALSHRVILSQEANNLGLCAADILEKAKETVEAPFFAKKDLIEK